MLLMSLCLPPCLARSTVFPSFHACSFMNMSPLYTYDITYDARCRADAARYAVLPLRESPPRHTLYAAQNKAYATPQYRAATPLSDLMMIDGAPRASSAVAAARQHMRRRTRAQQIVIDII